MQTEWEGYYLDGRTAARQRVAIRLKDGGLEGIGESVARLWWPYAEIRQTQGFYAGEQVRLEKGGEVAQTLLVSDPAFLSVLHQVAPQFTAHFHDPARRRLRVKLTGLAAVAAAGIITVLYLWGIPALVEFATPRVPVSWEERLGEAVATQLAPPEQRCTDPARAQVIDDVLAALTAPLPNSPYTFRVIVVNDPAVNAFAAPGGYIVLFRGLIEQTRTAEELAGVLAHEVQHVLQRHSTRALLQHAATGLLLAALTGDASSTMDYGRESARALSTLQYSRRREETADAGGMQMLLAAGIDPMGMITFFESLKEKERTTPAVLQYLSTHPSTDERIEKLKALTGQSPRSAAKLLRHYNWRDIDKICPAPTA
ncbi:MAG TPA: M48 family metallopeptidase [Candidatus Binatia bacterium]|nr:M48 family metallopeptidase [Candidatus Binatia bacterium]